MSEARTRQRAGQSRLPLASALMVAMHWFGAARKKRDGGARHKRRNARQAWRFWGQALGPGRNQFLRASVVLASPMALITVLIALATML